jgi:hypothetical protein
VAGRPFKFTPEEALERARWYLENHTQEDDLVPTVAGLAVYLKCSKSVLYEYQKHPDYAELTDVMAELMTKQHKMLTSGGLGGRFHPVVTRIMLSKHGDIERREVDNLSSDGSMSPVAPISAADVADALRSVLAEL